MGHPRHADEALDKLQHGALSVRGQKPGYELCSNAVHVQITRDNYLHCSVSSKRTPWAPGIPDSMAPGLT